VRMPAGLVVSAMEMAVAQRGGDITGIVFHHDRDTQYLSRLMGQKAPTATRCRAAGASGTRRPSARQRRWMRLLLVSSIAESAGDTRTPA
jgi:hypothetical protein